MPDNIAVAIQNPVTAKVGTCDNVLEITEYDDHIKAAITANIYPEVYCVSKEKLPPLETKRKAPNKPNIVPKI
jgi:hypothetical protein